MQHQCYSYCWSCLFLGVAGNASAGVTPPREAGPIDFTMTDTNNQPVTLSTFRCKVVVVEVFATWCHNCANERAGPIDLQQKANDEQLPLQIIGIASADTSRDTVRAYVKDNGINYPVVFMDSSRMCLSRVAHRLSHQFHH